MSPNQNGIRRHLAQLVGLLALLALSAPSTRALAEPPPVVLVPVVTDPDDEPRLLALARALQNGLAAHQIPIVAARYASSLKAAKGANDSFAAALGFVDDFAVLRYAQYSDEVARDHARRLAELANARHTLLVAAPIAHRFLVRRISRGEGESLNLPDPYDPALIAGALSQLVPLEPREPEAPAPTSEPAVEHSERQLPRRYWALASTGALTLGALAATAVYATRRLHLGNDFQALSPQNSGYLETGDAWRSARAPLLVSAALGSASATATAILGTLNAPKKRLLWLSIPALAVGAGALAWAAVDLAHGARCPASSEAALCVHAESQLDRGLLLALVAAPLLSVSATHLGRWLTDRLQIDLSASHRTVTASVALLH